jgi:hypothetical protein
MVRNIKAKRSVFQLYKYLLIERPQAAPNKRRAKGYVHAYSICVAQIEAADSPAAKPVSGMRRRDHSCRD